MADRSSLYARYLGLLGFRSAPAGIEGLRQLVRGHLCRVPWENVTKLLLLEREGAGRAVTLEEFLDGVEKQDLGGTCHSLNPYFADLLRYSGFDADLYAADMTTPNCHTSIRVKVDGVPYHVDVGYGGPFREPMRLDSLPYRLREGNLSYELNRNSHEDAYEMSLLSGSERVHGYVVHEPPRSFEFFAPQIRDSFSPGRRFVSSLRIVRFFEDYSLELINRTLTFRRGDEFRETELRNLFEMKEVLATQLEMSRCPIEEALAVLERLTGAPFY